MLYRWLALCIGLRPHAALMFQYVGVGSRGDRSLYFLQRFALFRRYKMKQGGFFPPCRCRSRSFASKLNTQHVPWY